MSGGFTAKEIAWFAERANITGLACDEAETEVARARHVMDQVTRKQALAKREHELACSRLIKIVLGKDTL